MSDVSAERVPVKGLIGVAIDVSGSMKASVNNAAHSPTGRLDSFWRALREARDRIFTAGTVSPASVSTELEIFVYIFGLSHISGGVCDLLALLKAAEQPDAVNLDDVTPEDLPGSGLIAGFLSGLAASSGPSAPEVELEKIAATYGRSGWDKLASAYLPDPGQLEQLVVRLRSQPGVARLLANLLPAGVSESYLTRGAQAVRVRRMLGYTGGSKDAADGRGRSIGGAAAKKARDMITPSQIRDAREARELMLYLARPVNSRESESEAVSRIRDKIGELLFERVREIGNVTLKLEEVAEKLLPGQDGASQMVEEFIYGGTPMRQTASMASDRFKQEIQRRGDGAQATLVLITDGLSMDGDPSRLLGDMRSSDITIVSCYVTDHDVIEPRRIPGSMRDDWDAGARLLFGAASQVPRDHFYLRHLAKMNWVIEDNPRLFIQINHSDLIAEVIRMLTLPAAPQ
jgi:hypothetical protein